MSKDIPIKIFEGKTLMGYLALPPNLKPGQKAPGLVLIQEIFGVNRHIRQVADQWAKEGYIVLAPDMFWRQEAGLQLGYDQAGFEKGIACAGKMDTDKAVEDIKNSIATLRKMPECNGKVGIFGFCMGGKLSYLAAASTDVDVAVCYYGGGIDQYLNEAEKIKCPITLHFGALDKHIAMTSVQAIEKALSGHKNAQVFVYDADHGFNCTERPSFNKAASDLAFTRSLETIKGVIGP